MGRSKASTEYQELNSNDVTGTATIVYDSTLETEIIQTQKYLDWIKTHYGTALIFKAAKRVHNGQTH